MGNNAFAYCLNNPIIRKDPTGELSYPGEIHDQVKMRLALKYGLYTEQRIQYAKGYGRADLISADGQVWDIKRDRPRQIQAGKKQVNKYVANTWARTPDVSLSVGGDWLQLDSFNYKSGLTTYKVTTRYAGNGVIAYDYEVSDFDYETAAIGTASIVVSVACLFLSLFTGVPLENPVPVPVF